jgi:flagellar protein FliO/FliZ
MVSFSKKNAVRALLCITLLCAGFYISAQEASVTQTPTPAVDETTVFLDTPAQTIADGANKASSANSIWILLRVVLVLAIVCAGIYGVVYLLKRTTKINAGNDPYLKNIASLALSPNKSVRVISVGSQAFIIGVTDQAISLIAELTDRELIDAMNLESDKNSSVPVGSFASVLTSFLPKAIRPAVVGTKEEDSETLSTGDSASALATSDFLKKQRERIKNGTPE